MITLQDNMFELRKQLEKGAIQKAYKGLLGYMLGLQKFFSNQYPDFSSAGSLYNGYLDMTYFSIVPKALKSRDLKFAIVFLYDTFRFEIWLSGKNKAVMDKFWKEIKAKHWTKYKNVEPTRGVDAVLEHTLVENPDFSDLENLTKKIEQESLVFIQDVMEFLDKNNL